MSQAVSSERQRHQRTVASAAEQRGPQSLAAALRTARFARFSQFAGDGPLRILDVGGTSRSWTEAFNHTPPHGWQVTVLSQREVTGGDYPWICTMPGDPRALPFEDKAFDVVFSNSVIEHIGQWSDQQRMASEVQRAGSRYFVRTRNYYFPIEAHGLLPGFQFLPIHVRAWLLTQRPFGRASRKPLYADARRYVSSIRLLTASELRRLFPNCQIIRERAGGLTKSLIAHS
jgi:SAM-dependent methyltransferase